MELEEGDFLEGSEERWEVLRFLGKGKCCTVFETRREGVEGGVCKERRAALKFYKKENKYTSAGMNEAGILRLLHSKDNSSSAGKLFIVELLDVFHCNGHLCLLNPLLSCSLHHVLTKTGWTNGLPLSLYLVQKCCRDLTLGLKYLRDKGIIHADIKPTNIMWNSETEVFQFVDFGLSFTEGQQPSQQIQSPGFQAPEVQDWNRNVVAPVKEVRMCGSACDMWSMACILFLLHTGQLLFHAKHQLPLICHHCNQGDSVNCIHSLTVKNHFQSEHDCSKEQHEALCDLLLRMVKCRPEERLTPSNILDHSFLSPQLLVTNPSLADLLFLPTRVLQLTNMFEDASELNQSEEYEDFIDDIKQECSKFGGVKSVWVPSVDGSTSTDLHGKVFVEFENAQDCEEGQRSLSGRTFNKKPVITSFLPIKAYRKLYLLTAT